MMEEHGTLVTLAVRAEIFSIWLTTGKKYLHKLQKDFTTQPTTAELGTEEVKPGYSIYTVRK